MRLGADEDIRPIAGLPAVRRRHRAEQRVVGVERDRRIAEDDGRDEGVGTVPGEARRRGHRRVPAPIRADSGLGVERPVRADLQPHLLVRGRVVPERQQRLVAVLRRQGAAGEDDRDGEARGGAVATADRHRGIVAHARFHPVEGHRLGGGKGHGGEGQGRGEVCTFHTEVIN